MAHTDFRTALQGANEIEITVTGRTSGRSLSYPVWFALAGDKLYLLPARGSDTDWYKNLRKTPTIRLEARGKTFTASARLLTDEAQVGEVVKKRASLLLSFVVSTTLHLARRSSLVRGRVVETGEAYACNRLSRPLRCPDRTGPRCRTA